MAQTDGAELAGSPGMMDSDWLELKALRTARLEKERVMALLALLALLVKENGVKDSPPLFLIPIT